MRKKERSEVGAAAAEGLSLTSVRIILTLCRHAGNVLGGGTGGARVQQDLEKPAWMEEGKTTEGRESRFLSLSLSLSIQVQNLSSLPPFVCVSIAGNSL